MMSKMKYLGMILIALMINSCIDTTQYTLLQTDKNATKQYITLTKKSRDYRILAHDRVDVVLYKNPNQEVLMAQAELGQSVHKTGILVDSTGYITLPLIGSVKVKGFTQSKAAKRIEEKYKKYINTPSVYVEVLNKRLFVLGEVNRPGVVKIDKENMTLFEALAFAGDITDNAMRHNIMIVSATAKGKMKMRRIDLTKFDKMNLHTLMLKPNDIVYVQPNDWKLFKVASDDITSIFKTTSTIVAPFVALKYLQQ